jgi:hypothetical protein
MLDRRWVKSGLRLGGLIVVFGGAGLFTGCAATVPMALPDLDLQMKMSAPPQNGALIYVYRNEAFGGAVKMPVFIDGAYRGDTVAKSFLVAPVPPGPHEVLSKAENDSRTTVMAEPGRAYFVWQEVKMGLVMARSQLQQVNETRGRAAVNECRLIASSGAPANPPAWTPPPSLTPVAAAPLPNLAPVATPPPNLASVAALPPPGPAQPAPVVTAPLTSALPAPVPATLAPATIPYPGAPIPMFPAPPPAAAMGLPPTSSAASTEWSPAAVPEVPAGQVPPVAIAAPAPGFVATPVWAPAAAPPPVALPNAVSTTAASPRAPGAERHDGFFLRFSLGPGYAAAREDKTSGKLSGSSATGIFAIGFSPIEDLAIHLNSEVDMVFSGQVDLPAGRAEDDKSDTLRNVGVGISYYLMPLNLYFSGALLAAKGYRQPAGQSKIDESKWGVGLSLSAGKEWWVSDNWGLGVFGRFHMSTFDGQGAGEKYTTNALTLGGSFTFN